MIFILLASEPSDLVVTSTAHSKQAAGATSGYVCVCVCDVTLF